jgi:hypothetical protein
MSGMAKTFGFDLSKGDDCLLGHAQLCESIARACADELSAKRFKDLAQRCRDVAAKD